MNFSYTAKNQDGETVTGNIESTDRFAAAVKIRSDGFTPLAIKKGSGHGKSFNEAFESFFGKVKLQEKIVFARNLSGMLTAGLSLARGLEILERQTKNKTFKIVLNSLSERINRGSTLSEALEAHPKVFSSLFSSMVKAGEESGKMAESLREIGVQLDKSYTLKRKVKGAMTYPAIIVSAMVLIGILMLIFVVPTLTKTFEEIGVELPGSTRFIIFISDMFSNNILFVIIFFIILVVGGMYGSRLPKVKKFFYYLIVRLPAIGKISVEINTARTARTLSSLLASGVSLIKALEIARDVLQNVYYKKAMEESIEAVQKGIPLSEIIKKYPSLYPIMMTEMVTVGEETGNLSQMLEDIATFYEAEVDSKTKNLATIIEPVLMILIGGAVGFFAVSMIKPMYSLLDNIG